MMAEYIERRALMNAICLDMCERNYRGVCTCCTEIELIQKFPTADVVEAVRCKDCKHWMKDVAGCTDFVGRCSLAKYMVGAPGYCVYGERRNDETTTREILFRGKRIDNGEWVEGWYVHTKRHHCITTGCIDDGYVVYGHYASDVAMYVVDPATIGQYTGLQDKNGAKIFEGDIIKFNYTGENRGVEGVAEVVFINGTFGVEWGRHKVLVWLDGFANTTKEVIGNIHDNPELIGGAE